MMIRTLRLSQSGTDSQPAYDATQPSVPRLKLAAGCLGKCKSSILSKFSQGTPGAEWRTGCPGRRAPREGRILSASVEKRVQEKDAAASVQRGRAALDAPTVALGMFE